MGGALAVSDCFGFHTQVIDLDYGMTGCQRAKSPDSRLFAHRYNRRWASSATRAPYTSAMSTFNRDLARKMVNDRDRDKARFFAGRQNEIRLFDNAVEEAGESKQAVFRVHQGAPGCGKTSLAAHLRAIRSDDVLFVDVAKKHLADDDALARRVRDTAGSTGTKIVSAVLRSIGSTLRMQPAGEALGSAVEGKTFEKSTIVLLMDEAQRIDETVQDVLVDLHTIGLGVPTVFLFSGLSHTADRIGSLEGLSRPGDNAIVNVGAMSEGECSESTRMMLTELRVDGTDDEREEMTGLAAALSHGWPQHLHCVQAAMCRELLRTDGVLREVSVSGIGSESDQRRGDYYQRRLSGTMLNARDATLTAAVVKRTMDERPGDEVTLADICGEEIHRAGLDDNPNFKATPDGIASLLLERGVLAIGPDNRYDVAIPSMAQWLGISQD